MKARFYLGVLTLLAAVMVTTISALAFEEPKGHAGITWDTPIGQLPSMEYSGKAKDDPETSVYRRKDEDLNYGRARLAGVEYGFSDGRLSQVVLKVSSLLQYLLMKEEAFRRFGEGLEIDERSERFLWEGRTTVVRLISAFDMS